MKNEGGAGQIECRLMIDGKVIEFAIAGPLVALAPAAEKTAKKQSKRGVK